jgi:hypothetical protein
MNRIDLPHAPARRQNWLVLCGTGSVNGLELTSQLAKDYCWGANLGPFQGPDEPEGVWTAPASGGRKLCSIAEASIPQKSY